jgi:HEAT repeat protein
MTEPNDVEEAVEILEEGSREEQKEEALSTLEECSHTRPEDLTPYLGSICSFADDEDIMIRRDVATILSNVAAHEPSAVIPHTTDVCTLLMDDDPSVLMFAMGTAMIIANESPTELLDVSDRLLDLLSYENIASSYAASNTRLTAATTLGLLGEVDATVATQADEPLADRFDDPEPNVRRDAVAALTRLGLAHPDAVPTGLTQLSTRLDDPEPEVRRKAIRAYTLFRHDQPAAIAHPEDVAPAFKQAAEQAGPELDSAEKKKIIEAHQYISDMVDDGA